MSLRSNTPFGPTCFDGLHFNYDADGLLVGVTRSNKIDTVYGYDKAGSLNAITHGSIIALNYTLDAAGQVISAEMETPLDPGAYLDGASAVLGFNASSEIATTGYVHDSRGRQTLSPTNSFGWDGASRLKTVGTNQLEYDGLGALSRRISGGNSVDYEYNYAIAMTPLAAEVNTTSGAAIRYYVWGPQGQLLYAVDPATKTVAYFHFDRQGSTLALTDAKGAVTDSYAYSPYGMLLHHQGSSSQPFMFNGQWGVRREGQKGSLYQMRARYYDADSARFLSRDPHWPAPLRLRELNPYGFAAQNPLSYIDPLGLSVEGAKTRLQELIAGAYNGDAESIKGMLWVMSGEIHTVDYADNLDVDYGVAADQLDAQLNQALDYFISHHVVQDAANQARNGNLAAVDSLLQGGPHGATHGESADAYYWTRILEIVDTSRDHLRRSRAEGIQRNLDQTNSERESNGKVK